MPTVGIEAGLKRRAIHARMSHAMPVSRNIHQGPASRASPARVLDPMSVRSCVAFMSSFLPEGGYRGRIPHDARCEWLGAGPVRRTGAEEFASPGDHAVNLAEPI